jgi:transposase InsO family protein
VAPTASAPDEVSFAEVVDMIQQARGRALSAVNTALVDLYWRIGEYISRKLEAAAWGEGVVEELARYIQRRHPGLRGFTRPKEHESLAVLCRVHGVSRKTGYKWVGRFKQGGRPALNDRSRRWRSHPQTTAPDTVELVVGTRKRHPTWGPRKLRAWILRRGYQCPSASTVGAILKREGYVVPKRRTARTGEFSDGLTAQDSPNAVWGADFKGWFRLSTGAKCYPLTVSDGYSRYLLCCDALAHPDEKACLEAFDALFKKYGLPQVLRTDNGTPFSGVFGVSSLSVWWVKLGIKPERIQRGKPSQNGRHERMHRTLKADAIQAGVAQRMYLQQRAFPSRPKVVSMRSA